MLYQHFHACVAFSVAYQRAASIEPYDSAAVRNAPQQCIVDVPQRWIQCAAVAVAGYDGSLDDIQHILRSGIVQMRYVYQHVELLCFFHKLYAKVSQPGPDIVRAACVHGTITGQVPPGMCKPHSPYTRFIKEIQKLDISPQRFYPLKGHDNSRLPFFSRLFYFHGGGTHGKQVRRLLHLCLQCRDLVTCLPQRAAADAVFIYIYSAYQNLDPAPPQFRHKLCLYYFSLSLLPFLL